MPLYTVKVTLEIRKYPNYEKPISPFLYVSFFVSIVYFLLQNVHHTDVAFHFL